ncbi:hypothetical protein BKA57DRAFT_448523 [Linnemannia elongata]|nr:hypothetical protein BKA57DRAFT_448523 [Linnemannia elongata]
MTMHHIILWCSDAAVAFFFFYHLHSFSFLDPCSFLLDFYTHNSRLVSTYILARQQQHPPLDQLGVNKINPCSRTVDAGIHVRSKL